MDSNFDDKIINQIETGLSKQMKEDLFTTGLEKINSSDTQDNMEHAGRNYEDIRQDNLEYTDRSYEDIRNQIPPLSRAEYIRQARAACLRQLNNISDRTGSYEDYSPDIDTLASEKQHKKKRGLGLFQDGSSPIQAMSAGSRSYEENTPQDIASFRSLIVRTVCAIVIFLLIFAFDKFDLAFGEFTSEAIRKYVTSNDTLKMLEELMVTWLK